MLKDCWRRCDDVDNRLVTDKRAAKSLRVLVVCQSIRYCGRSVTVLVSGLMKRKVSQLFVPPLFASC